MGEDAAKVARVRHLLADMRAELNSDRDAETGTYDAGADDQLATDIRRLAAALRDGDGWDVWVSALGGDA